jgi:hypothetical protein
MDNHNINVCNKDSNSQSCLPLLDTFNNKFATSVSLDDNKILANEFAHLIYQSGGILRGILRMDECAWCYILKNNSAVICIADALLDKLKVFIL